MNWWKKPETKASLRIGKEFYDKDEGLHFYDESSLDYLI